MTLWTLREVKRAIGTASAGENFDISGVSIDSRSVQAGDLFFALMGERDGHDFVKMAEEKGAVAAVVSKKVEGVSIEQILVSDTFKALQDLGLHRRRHAEQTKRIAVTGSCGKTTVKEMLGAVLKCHKSEGSYNNHLGVPLTLARMAKDAGKGVFEIGMNHPGEILPLAEMVKPHIAVVTTIAPVHIGAFESEREIAVEKLSIQHGLEKGGVLVTSDEVYEKYTAYFDEKPVLFSMKADSDAYVSLQSVSQSVSGQNVVAEVGGEPLSFRLHLFGEHAVYNALAVLAVAKMLKVENAHIISSLESMAPVKGRGNVHDVDGIYVVDESYNANPASMHASIKTLISRPGKGRRIAILGEMRELGEGSPAYHKALADVCAPLDTVITVGADMKYLHDALRQMGREGQTLWHFDSAKDMNLQKLVHQLEMADIVMVKASKSVFYVYDFVARFLGEIKRLKVA